MNYLSHLGIQPLLDVLEGIAYLTSPEDVILAYGRPNWETFARENSAPHLARADEVVGRSLFDFITGHRVQAAHRAAAELVRSGWKPEVHYTYRCDAPDIRRELRLSITPLVDQGALLGLLYHSVSLREISRPVIRILSPVRNPVSPDQQLISICSYCRSIHLLPEDAVPRWITPERYYELGLDDQVQVSHGICPDCWRVIVQPMLDELTTASAGPGNSTGGSANPNPHLS